MNGKLWLSHRRNPKLFCLEPEKVRNLWTIRMDHQVLSPHLVDHQPHPISLFDINTSGCTRCARELLGVRQQSSMWVARLKVRPKRPITVEEGHMMSGDGVHPATPSDFVGQYVILAVRVQWSIEE